jgi:hypothetical protein
VMCVPKLAGFWEVGITWTSKDLSDTAAYSSITVADVQGVRTYMTFTASARETLP